MANANNAIASVKDSATFARAKEQTIAILQPYGSEKTLASVRSRYVVPTVVDCRNGNAIASGVAYPSLLDFLQSWECEAR